MGNDFESLFAFLGDPISYPLGSPNPSGPLFGSNDTNAGIFGADLAPAAELLFPIGRVGYVADVGAIPDIAGITAQDAVDLRNAFKADYRLGLFPETRMGSYDAFVAAGKTDAQIIASAGRTNAGVNAAAVIVAGSAAAHP